MDIVLFVLKSIISKPFNFVLKKTRAMQIGIKAKIKRYSDLIIWIVLSSPRTKRYVEITAMKENINKFLIFDKGVP